MLNYLTSDPSQERAFGTPNISAPSVEKKKNKKIDNNGFETFGENGNWINGNIYNKSNYDIETDTFKLGNIDESIISIPKSKSISINTSIPKEIKYNDGIDLNNIFSATENAAKSVENEFNERTDRSNSEIGEYADDVSNKTISEFTDKTNSNLKKNKKGNGIGTLAGFASKIPGIWGKVAAGALVVGDFALKATQPKYGTDLIDGNYASAFGGTVAENESLKNAPITPFRNALNNRNDILNNDASNAYFIMNDARNRNSAFYTGQEEASRFNKKINGTVGNFLAKNGMKLISKKEAQQLLVFKTAEENQIQAYQNGGSILVPDGALHAHKHHMDDVNPDLAEDLTKKGIPVVVTDEKGNVEQVAEIEKEEIIMEKSLTKKIEELWHKGDEDSMIEAGKLIVDTLFTNCDDNAELIDRVE